MLAQRWLRNPKSNPNHELWPFELTPVTPAPENIHTICFSKPFCCYSEAIWDRQTDKQRDGGARPIMRPIRMTADTTIQKYTKKVSTTRIYSYNAYKSPGVIGRQLWAFALRSPARTQWQSHGTWCTPVLPAYDQPEKCRDLYSTESRSTHRHTNAGR